MIRLFSFCLIFLLGKGLKAQPEVQLIDHIYLPNIKSVKCYLNDLVLTYPIIDLNAPARLVLQFDDLDGDVKRYTYTLIHCDANWQPSSLAPSEYMSGFQESTIDNYDYSFSTVQEFTHYWLTLPNEDMTFTLSGNYILVVYEDEQQRRPALTRRFVVVEPVVEIEPRVTRPARVDLADTHQEIDFVVYHPGFIIRSPRTEVTAHVLQNGRWDNAVMDLRPLFVYNERLSFDYQDKVVFAAGKEFRYADLRSLRYPTDRIAWVEEKPGKWEVGLLQDRKRAFSPYVERRDLNGKFVIETHDDNDQDLESDYAYVFFSLYSPTPIAQTDVYLFGGMTDWELKPEFKMVYNPAISAYVCKPLLKQGYYDYMYVTAPKGQYTHPDWTQTEGNWYETENEYTILIYYRPFGARYDRLIGAHTFSSRQ